VAAPTPAAVPEPIAVVRAEVEEEEDLGGLFD
jgi:hypothetical protein